MKNFVKDFILNKAHGRKIKAIIFDWNGVITDSLKLDHEIFLKECDQKGLKVSRSKSFYANLFNDNVYACFKKIGFEVNAAEENLYKSLYIQGIPSIKPFDGVKQMIDMLKGNYKLAIITSNYANHVRKFFNNHGINGFSLILGSETDRRKENKIKILMEKLSVAKDEIIFVGDTVSDIKACKASGIPIIAAAWGYQRRSRLAEHKPNYIAGKPEDVTKILESIENGKTADNLC